MILSEKAGVTGLLDSMPLFVRHLVKKELPKTLAEELLRIDRM